MSTERDTARIVRSWLEEGRTTLPDWVRDDVFDRLPATPQRRSRGTAWRFLTMPTAAKTAIAAAAVILVAVGAFAFLQRPTGPAATPTTSPTTAPTPTLTAEPSEAVTQLPSSGEVPPGTYRMGRDASIVLAIPSGWTVTQAGLIRKNHGQEGELTLWVDASDIMVYPDICATATEPPPVGPSADDLLAALRAQENSVLSEPGNVTVGGREVMRIELTAAEGLDWAGCTEGFVKFWRSSTDIYSSLASPGTTSFNLVQTPAGRIVFDYGHADDASAADVAELDAIVESMVIEP